MNFLSELRVDGDVVKIGLTDDGDGARFIAVFRDSVAAVDAVTKWLAERGLKTGAVTNSNNIHLGKSL